MPFPIQFHGLSLPNIFHFSFNFFPKGLHRLGGAGEERGRPTIGNQPSIQATPTRSIGHAPAGIELGGRNGPAQEATPTDGPRPPGARRQKGTQRAHTTPPLFGVNNGRVQIYSKAFSPPSRREEWLHPAGRGRGGGFLTFLPSSAAFPPLLFPSVRLSRSSRGRFGPQGNGGSVLRGWRPGQRSRDLPWSRA